MNTEVHTRLISRKHVKALALEIAAKRAHKFRRFGGEFLVKCEANLKEFIRNHVGPLPSKGKTIT